MATPDGHPGCLINFTLLNHAIHAKASESSLISKLSQSFYLNDLVSCQTSFRSLAATIQSFMFESYQLNVSIVALFAELDPQCVQTSTTAVNVDRLIVLPFHSRIADFPSLLTTSSTNISIPALVKVAPHQPTLCLYMLADIHQHHHHHHPTTSRPRSKPHQILKTDEKQKQEQGQALTNQNTKIPVTILTGFLGSGKTTLLNYILKRQSDMAIAVIENEFGEIAIDNDLLMVSAQQNKDDTLQSNDTLAGGASLQHAAETVIVMENGCMCCTIRGDLLGAFQSIIDAEQAKAASSARNQKLIDAVIIETTGMANPVPIVRTIRNTPMIAEKFEINSVVTLVDAKNILKRLEELEDAYDNAVESHTDPRSQQAKLNALQEDEAFQQILFADKIILSKVDMVSPQNILHVWTRIRRINENAPMIACVRGHLDPHELYTCKSFDMEAIASEDEDLMKINSQDHDHDHHESCHDHNHNHNHKDCYDSPRDHNLETGSFRHNRLVSTFGISKDNMQVDPLMFLWWLRKLATLKPQDQGILYRSKGILVVAGSNNKMIFHAVCDVIEKEELTRVKWQSDESRCCRLVFIGKMLDKAWFESSFERCLIPIQSNLSHNTNTSSTTTESSDKSGLELLYSKCPSEFYRILYYLDRSNDVARLGLTSKTMYTAVYGNSALSWYPIIFEQSSAKYFPRIKHGHDKRTLYNFHQHHSMHFIRTYLSAAKRANLSFLVNNGLDFDGKSHIEAAGVTWIEAGELADKTTQNYVAEFSWRKETLDEFFSSPAKGTTSSLIKLEYDVEDEFGDPDVDVLKFKVILQPEKVDQDQSLPDQHRLYIQLIGGKSSSQVYLISFHSIHPNFQIHVKVEDHRMQIFKTKEVFYKQHPLMDAIRKEHKLRMLIRVKPDGSGPLGDMCGCC